MDKIFMQAKDKNVAAVMIYAISGYACFDPEGANKMSAAELQDAFVKGCIIVDNNGDTPVMCRIISMTKVDNFVMIEYGTDGNELYSKEYSA